MPDPTPAAAAPATPAAAPAAPAPAPAPTPAAPVAASTPAPAPAPTPAPAPSAAPVADSLIPAEPAAPAPAPESAEAKLAAARALIKEADAAADPNSGKAWLLNEGVMGVGEKPAWFNTAKYKTVAAQAEAYTHLESRFGAFKGAPPDGNYVMTLPEGMELKADHPMAVQFTKWARESQLSQEGYTHILGMLAQYQKQITTADFSQIKAGLGDNADARIATVAQWGKANLGAEGFATLRAATSGKNAADVFKVLEAVIAKTGQVRMPKPGPDVPGAGAKPALQAIEAKMGVKDAQGKLRIHTDPAYHAAVDKEYRDYFAAQEAAA